jgi:hypothetical protein
VESGERRHRPGERNCREAEARPLLAKRGFPGLFLPPDVVTDASYTLCWKGVVSPVVCTSGTKLCW